MPQLEKEQVEPVKKKDYVMFSQQPWLFQTKIFVENLLSSLIREW